MYVCVYRTQDVSPAGDRLLSTEEQVTLITESMTVTSTDQEKLLLLNKNTELRRVNKEVQRYLIADVGNYFQFSLNTRGGMWVLFKNCCYMKGTIFPIMQSQDYSWFELAVATVNDKRPPEMIQLI